MFRKENSKNKIKMDSSDEDEVIDLLDNSALEEEDYYLSSYGSNSNNNEKFTPHYELLSTSGLIYHMKKDVLQVVNVICVSEPIARCLLNQYKWNVEQLVNDYFNASDLNEFFQSTGIDNPEADPYNEPSADRITDCGICYTSFAEAKATGFVCGHKFCESCCGRYFEAKILNDGEGNMIKCPDPDCKVLIDDETIIDLIPENVKHHYQILITQSYVLSNTNVRYCRSEGCEYAVKVQKVEATLVVCKCGLESCFQCGEMWHDSVTCALLKKWKQQLTIDDPETHKWMLQHAKQCPKCAVNIEKNGGCNHMQCKSCKHEFCWICMGQWRYHGVASSCNQFRQGEQNSTKRLHHYSLRYNNHIKSMKFERGLYNSVEAKMKDLQGMEDLTRNEVLFLKSAVESLRRSRQILVSTYVFAYYSKESNQLLIFEDNQRDLELATENLSWFLEQDITKQKMADVKQKLQEKYVYCDKRRSVLLEHIHEGYERGYWEVED